MSATQQGSAAWAITMAGVIALIAGAIVLTFFFQPLSAGFIESGLFDVQTSEGARLTGWIEGVWTFMGGILLIMMLSYIWVVTRQ